jgi:ABC-type lipoprotein release transport system permease subunit
MVLRQGIRPVVAGTVLGLALAVYASRAARAFLLDVSPFDPPTFAGVTVLLVLVALAASYFPARRASLIEPTSALRTE